MSILLHKKYGLNPTIYNCFFCGEAIGLLLPGSKTTKFKKAGLADADGKMKSSIGCIDKEPCDKCKEYMKQGVILISIDEKKSQNDFENPYRTGGWCVVKDDYIKRVFESLGEKDLMDRTLKQRATFVPDPLWDKLRLPRGEIDTKNKK